MVVWSLFWPECFAILEDQNKEQATVLTVEPDTKLPGATFPECLCGFYFIYFIFIRMFCDFQKILYFRTGLRFNFMSQIPNHHVLLFQMVVWGLFLTWTFNLRAVIRLHFPISSLVLLPTPISLSVLSSFFLILFLQKILQYFSYDSCLAARRSKLVGGMCSMMPHDTGICCYAFIFFFSILYCFCIFLFIIKKL